VKSVVLRELIEGRRKEGWPNTAARLRGWMRVTQQGVILYGMDGSCRMLWRTVHCVQCIRSAICMQCSAVHCSAIWKAVGDCTVCTPPSPSKFRQLITQSGILTTYR
jgi:hypothetical protein